METNESILGREIVALADQKRVGKVEDLCVNMDTCSVVGFVVTSASTGTSLILPFDQALAIGDTFMTIDARDNLLATDMDQAKESMAEGFKLVGVDAFSRLGNALGTVDGYTFDTTYGTITEVILDDESSFSSDTFIFFAPDMIFLNDGGVTADELRRGKGRKGKAAKKSAKKTKSSTRKTAPKARAQKPVARPEVKPAPKPEPKPEPAPVQVEVDKDADVKEFLLGLVVTEDVKSEDGAFTVSEGTKLTQDIIDDAAKHDALLSLTLSVED